MLSGDIGLNPDPNNNASICKVLYLNIRGFYNNSDLQIASQKYGIILCFETLVSIRRHISDVLLPGLNNPILLLRESRPRVHELAA